MKQTLAFLSAFSFGVAALAGDRVVAGFCVGLGVMFFAWFLDVLVSER
jgi:hypothetical protein